LVPGRCAWAGAAPMTSRTAATHAAQPSRIRDHRPADRAPTRAVTPGGTGLALLVGRGRPTLAAADLSSAPPTRSRRKHMPLGRTAYRPQSPEPCRSRNSSDHDPHDSHLQPDCQTVKPTLCGLLHWGAGGKVDGSCCAHRQAATVQPLGCVARAHHPRTSERAMVAARAPTAGGCATTAALPSRSSGQRRWGRGRRPPSPAPTATASVACRRRTTASIEPVAVISVLAVVAIPLHLHPLTIMRQLGLGFRIRGCIPIELK
jgi:hypothetical protein